MARDRIDRIKILAFSRFYYVQIPVALSMDTETKTTTTNRLFSLSTTHPELAHPDIQSLAPVSS
jgi:hypothetical protein